MKPLDSERRRERRKGCYAIARQRARLARREGRSRLVVLLIFVWAILTGPFPPCPVAPLPGRNSSLLPRPSGSPKGEDWPITEYERGAGAHIMRPRHAAASGTVRYRSRPSLQRLMTDLPPPRWKPGLPIRPRAHGSWSGSRRRRSTACPSGCSRGGLKLPLWPRGEARQTLRCSRLRQTLPRQHQTGAAFCKSPSCLKPSPGRKPPPPPDRSDRVTFGSRKTDAGFLPVVATRTSCDSSRTSCCAGAMV